MKAIHIDPATRTIKYIELPEENRLPTLQSIVGGYITVGLAFANEDVMYVDDDGFLKDPQDFQIWHPTSPKPLFNTSGRIKLRALAGPSIIVGSSPSGEDLPCLTTIEEVESTITFADSFTIQILKQLGELS